MTLCSERLPEMVSVDTFPGADFVDKWKQYLEGIYDIYLRTVAFGKLTFRGLPIRCQFRPATFGKHYAFWHMMQEGPIENERTIDLERCKRVKWLSWVIGHADIDSRIRVFQQNRGREVSWVLWLHEHDYAVILWQRNGYFLLKTGFIVKPHKRKEFLRDWEKHHHHQKD